MKSCAQTSCRSECENEGSPEQLLDTSFLEDSHSVSYYESEALHIEQALVSASRSKDESLYYENDGLLQIDRQELNPGCHFNGKRARLRLDADKITVLQRFSRGPATVLMSVPLGEVYAVSMRTAVQSSTSTFCRWHDGPVLLLHTFKRRHFDWLPHEVSIDFDDEMSVACWVRHLQSTIEALPDRPARLFVVINPYGGSQRADYVWRDVVKPIFDAACISCDAFRTGYRDHAVELLEQMSWEQFSSYDGIVAVGGDGLFQECLRGVLALRARGGQWQESACAIRIAQVPAGSTDAVACTINGCRSAATAALHVAIGDRAKLDVLEARTQEGECRYACSTASYGFIGDVLGRSEQMRWMGPARYDVGGAVTLMRLQSYPVRLWYKPPKSPHAMRQVCMSDCAICARPIRGSGTGTSGSRASSMAPSVCAAELAISEAATTSSATPTAADAPARERTASPSVSSSVADAWCTRSRGGGSHEHDDRSSAAVPVAPVRRGFHMRGASGFDVCGSEALCAALSAAPRGEAGGAEGRAALPSTPDVASSDASWFATPRCRDAAAGGGGGDTASAADEGWRCWEGEVASLMVVVTPTRSDKTRHGIVPHAHLADGRLHLVIVRKCTRLQFFRFLLSLPRTGVDESLDFVDVKEVEAWRLEELRPGAPKSVWNVDGELMQTAHMAARCHHGLIEVFGRGPELL